MSYLGISSFNPGKGFRMVPDTSKCSINVGNSRVCSRTHVNIELSPEELSSQKEER